MALRVDPHHDYLLAQIDGVRIEVGLTGSNVGTALHGVPISQADLADFVGATCEGVAKILAEWRVRLGGAVTRHRARRRSPRPRRDHDADIN